VQILDWLMLIGSLVSLTVGNYLFYFGNRKLSYVFIFGAMALFVVGFVLAGIVRGDMPSAYLLMLTFLIAYVAERGVFLIIVKVLRRRQKDQNE